MRNRIICGKIGVKKNTVKTIIVCERGKLVMTAVKFVPKEKTRLDKKTGKMVKCDPYRSTTLDDMIDFLEENGTPEQKKTFKENCYLVARKVPTGKTYKKGKHKGEEIIDIERDETGDAIMEPTEIVNWLYARQKFFEQYAPEFLPPKADETKKNKKKVADRMLNW